MRRQALAALFVMPMLAVGSSYAKSDEDNKVYYGSRAGMTLTIVSREGLGTSNAVIRVEHTPKDAKSFCALYLQDNSMACVKRTMLEVKVGDRITADCKQQRWTDVYGQSYQLLGKNKKTDPTEPDYKVKDLQSNTILDGSSASGYDLEISLLTALCPGIIK